MNYIPGRAARKALNLAVARALGYRMHATKQTVMAPDGATNPCWREVPDFSGDPKYLPVLLAYLQGRPDFCNVGVFTTGGEVWAARFIFNETLGHPPTVSAGVTAWGAVAALVADVAGTV